MSNKLSKKRNIDADTFKQFLKEHNTSIRELGSVLDINEKTLRRSIDSGTITVTVALEICIFFNATCADIFGPDDSYEWALVQRYLN